MLLLLLSLVSTVRADDAFSVCPLVAENETALDCPWAEYARLLDPILKATPTPAAAFPKIEQALREIAPDFMKRLVREGKIAGDVKKLWGRSLNFDANAKAIIIPEPVIDVILAKADVPPREGLKVFAGFEHTYGYLLSNLKTPYGYKRLRWVRPDIENGFGLEAGTISPTPKSGGLFMNVSSFAGRIAFVGANDADKAALKIIHQAGGVSRSIAHYDYKSLHGRRLTETVTLAAGRTVEIRTDFVPFTKATGDTTGGNAELLVYSIRDSAEKLPYLISAFPIAKGFSDGALDPKKLGEGKPIVTQYNAFVAGVTDAPEALTGKREASTF